MAEVEFAVLAAATVSLCADVGYGHVRVWPMPAHLTHLNGQCAPAKRVVWYPRVAPLYTVAHEVAHLLLPHDGHGPRWKAAYLRLGRTLLLSLPRGPARPTDTT